MALDDEKILDGELGNADPASITTPDPPAETPADSATETDDPIARDVAEFEAATTQTAEGEAALEEITAGTGDAELNDLLAEARRNDAIAAGEIDPRDQTIAAYQKAEQQKQELEEFLGFGREILGKIPEIMPDKEAFVEKELIALAATDQQASLAWRMRNVNQEELRKYSLKLSIAWDALSKSVHPNKQQIAKYIQQEYSLAQLGLNSKQILTSGCVEFLPRSGLGSRAEIQRARADRATFTVL